MNDAAGFNLTQTLVALGHVPGVPAAGHLDDHQFWHPGSEGTCPKPQCKRKREKINERRY